MTATFTARGRSSSTTEGAHHLKINLRDGLQDELQALKRCARFTPGNSDPEKVILWVGVGLAVILTLGVAFGFVNYSAQPPFIQMMMQGFGALLVYLFGRTHGRELTLGERIERRVDELEK